MSWEYRVTNANAEENHEEMLNKLGLEGWELVTVNHRTPNSSTNFVFKRPSSRAWNPHLHKFTRSHGPPWECRLRRSASSTARTAHGTQSVRTAFPRGAWERVNVFANPELNLPESQEGVITPAHQGLPVGRDRQCPRPFRTFAHRAPGSKLAPFLFQSVIEPSRHRGRPGSFRKAKNRVT